MRSALRRRSFWLIVVALVLLAGTWGLWWSTRLPALSPDQVVVQYFRSGGLLRSPLDAAHPILTVYGDGRALLFPNAPSGKKQVLLESRIPADRLRSLLRQTGWRLMFAKKSYAAEGCADCGLATFIWARPDGLRSASFSHDGATVESVAAEWIRAAGEGAVPYIPEQAEILVRPGLQEYPACPADLPPLPRSAGHFDGTLTLRGEAVRSLVAALGGYQGGCAQGAESAELAIMPVPDLRAGLR